MKCYITRENKNYWMLTHGKPVIQRIGKIGPKKAYVPYGDLLGYRHICIFIASMFFSEADKMQILETVKIDITINNNKAD